MAANEAYKIESPTKEYTLTNPNASLEDTLNTVYNTTPRPTDGYVRPNYTSVVDSRIRDVNDLSKTLGVNFTYDRDEIEKIYQDATLAALRMEQNSGAERQYYNNLANAQNTMLDTIRQQYGSAVSAGANKGMQAANMLSAILGTTQTANEEATNLAAARQELTNKYAQQMRQDSIDALQYSNDMANTIGSLSHQLYNDEIQQKTAELAYNQGINTDYAGYQASKYTADANLLAALAGTGAGVYNNSQSAIAALEAAIETARGSKDTAGITKGNKTLEDQLTADARLNRSAVSSPTEAEAKAAIEEAKAKAEEEAAAAGKKPAAKKQLTPEEEAQQIKVLQQIYNSIGHWW